MSDPGALRVAVVGASSGLGRCIGMGLAGKGVHVAFLARRYDRLAKAANEAGNGAIGVRCDVTDADSCHRALSEVVDDYGGLDGLVYTTGRGLLSSLADVTADQWGELFATNVTGASIVTAAAATKAALDKLVEAWRIEQPGIAFTRLAVGDSFGGTGDSQTEFDRDWDPDALDSAIRLWMQRGEMQGGLVDADHLADVVHSVLVCGKSSFIPYLTLAPRPSAAVSELRQW